MSCGRGTTSAPYRGRLPLRGRLLGLRPTLPSRPRGSCPGARFGSLIEEAGWPQARLRELRETSKKLTGGVLLIPQGNVKSQRAIKEPSQKGRLFAARNCRRRYYPISSASASIWSFCTGQIALKYRESFTDSSFRAFSSSPSWWNIRAR